MINWFKRKLKKKQKGGFVTSEALQNFSLHKQITPKIIIDEVVNTSEDQKFLKLLLEKMKERGELVTTSTPEFNPSRRDC